LQRLTGIQRLLRGEVKPFGLSVTDLDGSRFSVKRSMFKIRLAVHDFQRRADLLGHYLDINAGGTPHSSYEIERVRALRACALESESAVGDDPQP
jgi:hypothetical protein